MKSTLLASLFFILFIFSLLSLIIGLIKPSLVKIKSRKLSLLIFGGATFLLFILIGVFAPPVSNQTIKPEANQENKESIPEITDNNSKVENDTTNSGITPINSTATSNVNPVVPENKTIPTNQVILYSVVKVVDGDTVDVNIKSF